LNKTNQTTFPNFPVLFKTNLESRISNLQISNLQISNFESSNFESYLYPVKFPLLAFFFLITLGLSAQPGKIPPGNYPIKGMDTLSPLQVVEQYVSPDGFPGKLKFFCCEMYREWYADSTLGQHLPKRVERECKVIFQDTGHAVVAVWMHDSATTRDVYFYLVKSKVWTIYAARSLVMTTEAKNELARLDSVPEKDRGKSYTKTHQNTFAFEYNNLKLWSSSDTVLAENFQKNKKKFFELQKLMEKKGYAGKNDTLVNDAQKDKKIKKLTDQLLIRNIDYDIRYPGCVFYIIGGMIDNTVGYMYQPDPKKIPHITEKHYIYLRSLGNGWYVFKTT